VKEGRAIPGDTLSHQRRAADPDASAWVSANAGSGKTHVLTQRVIRLLLAGVEPAKILCLTFTKAAAANMSLRVFRTLSQWTSLDDRSLAASIESIGAPRPGAPELVFARRLFARAIETPGGLKIQTIHAFCEAVLHRFPFEANVPAGFEVLDEESQDDLMRQARREALAQAAAEPRLSALLRELTAQVSAAAFDKILDETLAARDKIRTAIKDADDERFASRLREALGLQPDQTPQEVERRIVEDGLPPASEWGRLAARLEQGSANDQKQAQRLRAALAAPTQTERLAAYLDVFLTAKGEPRKQIVTSAIAKNDPSLASRLDDERDRVHALSDALKAAKTVERTRALLAVARTVFARYEALKARRGRLDFDDLIERTGRLVRRAGADWVLYKLDAGIDHVLVDEAQDTSAAQWDILRTLVEEFTAGRGAKAAARTIFAVGDEKQSIYSFQGAAPHLFDSMRRFFAAKHRDADKRFEPIALTLSFRSSKGVLDAVDTVFSVPSNRRGLSAEDEVAPQHAAWKSDLPGQIELWEPLTPAERSDPRDWALPLDALTAADPERILAERIADRIKSWIAPGSGEVVHDDDGPRPVRCGDILILVRKRGPLFEGIVRALKEKRLPVAGADRLTLAEHIAVMDLLAAGRVALLPEDDLSLACALKSPLIGFDDDDLIALAPGRPGSLWQALETSPIERCRQAARRIAGWRELAARSPFEFYARILGAEGGRRELVARLGPEASDAIDEFLSLALDHERRGGPSLPNFLHRMETSSVCVKRDMEAAGESVRVMTAHAAKGLEAKIVILPDTCSAASGPHDPKLYFVESPQGVLPFYNPNREQQPARLAQARTEERLRQDAEHRRLLYVAMTRAEERLYVAGVQGRKGRGLGCWYDMVANALAPTLVERPAPWNFAEAVRRSEYARPPATARGAPSETRPAKLEAPAWIKRDAPREHSSGPPLRPSDAIARDKANDRPDEAAQEAARLGALAHQLLQRLPGLPESARGDAARRFLDARAVSAETRERMVARALATLNDPRLARIFATNSRAEVALGGRVALPNGRAVEVAGVIDRLAETSDAVWIADFKTGGFRPGRPPPLSYVAQLALYRLAIAPLWPGRTIRALLVWIEGPHIVEPSAEEFERALRSLPD
jgi:ATP-dependent helicase/nuclease subunit A